LNKVFVSMLSFAGGEAHPNAHCLYNCSSSDWSYWWHSGGNLHSPLFHGEILSQMFVRQNFSLLSCENHKNRRMCADCGMSLCDHRSKDNLRMIS
jgi:hypothetical protein